MSKIYNDVTQIVGRTPLVRASGSAHAITLEQANQLGEGVAAQLRANGAG